MIQETAGSIISRFSHLKILVLGDFMLDQYIWGRVDRISPEAPVPIVDSQSETLSLGGAGNVVYNLRQMGAQPVPLGVTGKDWAGERVHQLLEEMQVSSDHILRSDRPTTLKTRIIAHQQQMVRVDREDRNLISDETQSELSRRFLSALSSVNGVIISDYSKGTVAPNLLAKILPEAKRQKALVCLDPKVRYFDAYSPVTVITPNQSEAGSLLGYPILTDADLEEAGRRILKRIDCQALLITRGEKGMALFSGGNLTHVPTRAREVYDVTGAGDTVISILCLALAAGAEMLDAVQLANAAAGIVVGKLGTAAATPTELIAAI
jgi:D-glycero-beta-D-manno-heptose-7-phosphate kinase